MTPYSMQQVVATASINTLVAARIAFPNPAEEILTIQKTVLIDRADVTLGNALLQGRLRACYTLAGPTGGTTRAPSPPGASQVWQAPLHALWAETGFLLAIAIAEAGPDMAVAVTEAHVTDQVATPQWDRLGRLLTLDDQNLLHLTVRLTRTVSLHPPAPAPDALAPPVTPHPQRRSAFTRFDSRASR